MRSTIEEDNKSFQQAVSKLDSEGFFDHWLGQVPSAIKAVVSSFADGDDDGGLWISPSGKVIDTQGISHAEFTANHYNLFGISQVDEDSILARAQADEGVMDFEEYLIVFLMEKGWTRIRVNDDHIFIDLSSGRQAEKCLSWAADALINTVGRSPDDVAHIETYHEGHFLTESPATLKSLWSGVIYTPLYSNRKSAIFNSPNSDGLGGGTRDNLLSSWFQVLADSVELQLKALSKDASASISVKNKDSRVYIATLLVSFKGKVYKPLVLEGSIGGQVSGRIFDGKLFSINNVTGLTAGLLRKVVSACKSKFGVGNGKG